MSAVSCIVAEPSSKGIVRLPDVASRRAQPVQRREEGRVGLLREVWRLWAPSAVGLVSCGAARAGKRFMAPGEEFPRQAVCAKQLHFRKWPPFPPSLLSP